MEEEPILKPGDVLALTLLGVDEVVIEFSGSGDSGAIDEFLFMDTRKKAVVKNVPDNIKNVIWDHFIEDILMNKIGDWYNNDGGQGHVTLKIPDLSYYIYTEYNPCIEWEYDEQTQEYVQSDEVGDVTVENVEGHLDIY